jgi:ectoine hydroxylase-related dioxygenase (phytanoyl-CoA dioxygenase family)
MDLPARRDHQQLDEDGFLVLENAIEPKRVKGMRDRLEELLAVTKQSHAGTLVVGGLLEEEVFDTAWNHPRVLAAVRHILGDEFRLTGVASRGIKPGHGQQALHVDWSDMPGSKSGVWYGCTVICALVDFTRENGATRVVPASHRHPWMLKTGHDARKPHPIERRLTGPAGTVFVLNIHCGHSAVHNASRSPRHAIFSCFSRCDSPLLVNGAIPVADPGPEVLARFDPEVQAILTAQRKSSRALSPL